MQNEPSPALVNALADLLPHIFVPLDRVRPWLDVTTGNSQITDNLSTGIGSAQLRSDVADALRRHGWLKVAAFWDKLEDAASDPRKPAVHELRLKFGIAARPNRPPDAEPATSTSAPKATQPAPKASTTHPAVPQQITVLLVSASPERLARLRVDQEFGKIINKIRGTRFRELFRFVQVPAARFDDLQTALLEYQPHVLHLSCHGEPDGSLKFETDDSNAGRITKKQLLRLLKSLRDNLRLVFVNACHSHKLVSDIPPTIDLAIGMSDAVPDDAATAFAVSFYEALGFGRTVENAFDIALAKLDDEEGDDKIPALLPLEAQDPDGKRRLVLVKPS